MEMHDSPAEVQQLKAWLFVEREILTAAGVICIVGEYSGSGDEGRMEDIYVCRRDGIRADYQLPAQIIPLIEKLEELYARPGYQDGDGGGGTFTLNVENCSIVHESYDLMVERYEHPEVTL